MAASRRSPPPPLIDLSIDWQAQYAPETESADLDAIRRARADVPRLESYLGATAVAFLSVDVDSLSPGEIFGKLARHEAEFAGRLLADARDFARWRDDRDGLTWGVLGVRNVDRIDDVDLVERLFARGVRVFVPSPAEELSDVARRWIARLIALESGPRPLLDLAALGPSAAAGAIAILQDHVGRAAPLRTRGPLDIPLMNRVRESGGLVGIGVSGGVFHTPDEVKDAASTLIRDHAGGVGLATEILQGGGPIVGLETVPAIQSWALRAFEPDIARAVLAGNAERFLAEWLDR